MSKVAILLTDYSPNYAPLFGNFAQQAEVLLKDAGINRDIEVFDAIKSEFPTIEQLKDIKAIWITGSTSDSFANDLWIVKLVEYLQFLLKEYSNIPLIGICFGHQVIARALGSKVDRNPKGWELGSYEIALTEDEEVRQLFGGVDSFRVLEVHQDIAFEVPQGYKNIGFTDKTEVQGFYKRGELLTFQGHPEFSEELVEFSINQRKKNGKIEEEAANEFLDSLKKGHDGKVIAKAILNFVEGTY